MKKIILISGLAVLCVLLIYGTYNYYSVTSETIVVGYLPSNHDSALFVADSNGMYKDQGIDIRLVPFNNGQELIEAADKNLIDVGYCGITPVTSAIDNNSHIKVVTAVNEEGSGVVVSDDSGITNASDFNGKKLLIPKNGSIQDVLFRFYLSTNDLNVNDLNISEMEVPIMQNELTSNETDGFVAWEPYVSQAKFKDNEDVVIYSDRIWPDHPCCVVISTDAFIKNKPDQLRKFLKVHVDATNYINTHKNETAVIVSKKLGTGIDVEKEALDHVKFIAIPDSEFDDNIMKLVVIQKQLGYVKNNLIQDQILNLSFLPNKTFKG